MGPLNAIIGAGVRVTRAGAEGATETAGRAVAGAPGKVARSAGANVGAGGRTGVIAPTLDPGGTGGAGVALPVFSRKRPSPASTTATPPKPDPASAKPSQAEPNPAVAELNALRARLVTPELRARAARAMEPRVPTGPSLPPINAGSDPSRVAEIASAAYEKSGVPKEVAEKAVANTLAALKSLEASHPGIGVQFAHNELAYATVMFNNGDPSRVVFSTITKPQGAAPFALEPDMIADYITKTHAMNRR